MSDFYTVPKGVTHALIKHSYVMGKILVPYDPLGILTDQLRKHHFTVVRNENEENIVDPIWWIGEKKREYDRVIS